MNALKQRWQSGCLAKVVIVGGALVLLVWWFLLCWFLVLFGQEISKAPLGEVRTTAQVTPTPSLPATTVSGPVAVATNTAAPDKTPQPAETPRPPASKPTVFPWEKDVKDTPEAHFAYQLGGVLGHLVGLAWGNLMVAYRNRIMLFIVLICVAWLLNRRRSKRDRK